MFFSFNYLVENLFVVFAQKNLNMCAVLVNAKIVIYF